MKRVFGNYGFKHLGMFGFRVLQIKGFVDLGIWGLRDSHNFGSGVTGIIRFRDLGS